MTEQSRHRTMLGASLVQAAAAILGVAGVFILVGQRDQALARAVSDIADLREITRDLAASAVESKTADAETFRTLEILRIRIERLEAKP